MALFSSTGKSEEERQYLTRKRRGAWEGGRYGKNTKRKK